MGFLIPVCSAQAEIGPGSMPKLPLAALPLSWRQADVFNYLFETVRMTGRQPTVRAIAKHFEIASPNGSSST